MRRDLVFKTAERLLGFEPSFDAANSSTSSLTDLRNTAVSAVSAAIQNPAFLKGALKHLEAGVSAEDANSREASGSRSSGSSGSGKKMAGTSVWADTCWHWWWRADKAVLHELLTEAAASMQFPVSDVCLERVRGVLAPYFDTGPVRARMRAAAYSIVGAYGWR